MIKESCRHWFVLEAMGFSYMNEGLTDIQLYLFGGPEVMISLPENSHDG